MTGDDCYFETRRILLEKFCCKSNKEDKYIEEEGGSEREKEREREDSSKIRFIYKLVCGDETILMF